MHVLQFFQQWSVQENPFRGEEARQDGVLSRMSLDDGQPANAGGSSTAMQLTHAEFEKILGDLARPASSIVFGEKGSGKTAIRLQIARCIREHNSKHPDAAVELLAYDDLNPFLDAYYENVGSGTGSPSTIADAFERIELVDHMDSVLTLATRSVVDQVLNDEAGSVRKLRSSTADIRSGLLLLASIYSPGEPGERRVSRLRKVLRLPAPQGRWIWTTAAWVGWIPALACAVSALRWSEPAWLQSILVWAAVVLAVAYAFAAIKRYVFDPAMDTMLARRVGRHIRVLPNLDMPRADAFANLRTELRRPGVLPTSRSDEPRYAMFERLRRVLNAMGKTGTIVLMDRIDEPTLVQGGTELMKSIVWPLLNNKFLQMPGFGVKMLLPIELRYALFRESGSFFQEARLDKQSLIERLSWTGATLYDLCTARLHACLADGATRISLRDLFEDNVTVQDVVDALDQMHQPRDAFKFVYRCVNEHCSNVSGEQGPTKIPKLVLEQVRKQEADRVQQLYRGIRPA